VSTKLHAAPAVKLDTHMTTTRALRIELDVGTFAVIMDSGGVQENPTELNLPCLTVCPEPERPITIGQDTNCLASNFVDLPVFVGQPRRGDSKRRTRCQLRHRSDSLLALPAMRLMHGAGRGMCRDETTQ
jgi:hypothetical protein